MQEFKKNTWFWKYNFTNSNEEMNDIIKIIQALENSNILIKGVIKAKNETKEQKRGF